MKEKTCTPEELQASLDAIPKENRKKMASEMQAIIKGIVLKIKDEKRIEKQMEGKDPYAFPAPKITLIE